MDSRKAPRGDGQPSMLGSFVGTAALVGLASPGSSVATLGRLFEATAAVRAGALSALSKEAGAHARRVLEAGGVSTWPKAQDRCAGELLSGTAYCDLMETIEIAHLAASEGCDLEDAGE